jgi:hypothetical protein
MTEIRGGAQSLRVDHILQFARRYVADVRSAGVDLLRFRLVDFEAGALKSFRGKLDEQRQPHVPQPDDTDVSLFVCY